MVGKIPIYILFPFLEVLMIQGRLVPTSEQRRASGKPWGASWHKVFRYPMEELRVGARVKVCWGICKAWDPLMLGVGSNCRGIYKSLEGNEA